MSKHTDYLKELGCDTKRHGPPAFNYTLLKHLEYTEQILREWGEPEYLQLAGLYHSVYGTPRFKHKSTENREIVRELIGEQAEEIVYQFSILKDPRGVKILTGYKGQMKQDLLQLHRANEKAKKAYS